MSTIKVNSITGATETEVEVQLPLKLKEVSDPGSPDDGHGVLYVRSTDNKLYYHHAGINSDVRLDLTAGATGAVSTYNTTADNRVLTSGGGAVIGGEANLTFDGSTLTVTGDGIITDDLTLNSDSAVFNMGAGNDFTITHDGTTGATLAGNPVHITAGGASTWKTTAGAILIDSEASTLTIDGHTGVDIDASSSGKVTIDGAGGIDIGTNANVAVDLNTSTLDIDASAGLTMTSTTMAFDPSSTFDLDAAGAITIDGASITLGGDSDTAFDIDTSTLDIDSSGAITIDGTSTVSIDGADDMNFTITSGTAGEDLTIQQAGANDSSIFITAAGTGTDAISIDATAGDMLIAPNLANGKTLKIGPTGAVQTTIAPHGTAGSELYSVINTAGTTDGSDATGAILLSSVAGGIGLAWANGKDLWAEGGQFIVTANHNTADAIKLHADAGSSQTITLLNDAGTAVSDSAAAIQVTSTAGAITLSSGVSNAAAIKLKATHASGGITLDANLGTIQFADNGVSLGTITSSGYSGNAATATTATVATTVTITDNESTSETNAIIFTAGGDLDGGNLGLESDGDLTYNPSSGLLTATSFAGNITGNLTGALQTAAQTNVTSLGTLTALTVDDVAIDGKVITMTGSTNDTAVFTAGTNGTLSIATTDTVGAAANITIEADGTFEADGTTVTLDSSGDIVLDADGGDIFFKDNTTTFGSATNTSGDLIIKSGTTTAATFSGANVTLAGTVGCGALTSTGVVIGTGFTIGSAAINESELETIDGVTAGTAAANKAVVLDGSKNISTLGTIACGVITQSGATLAATYSPIAGSSSLVTVGALDSGGSITSGFGSINNGSSAITTSGVCDLGATTVDSLDVSDGAIVNVGDIDCDSISVADAANGLSIDFSGAATATSNITIADNLAEALVIQEGSNDYLKIITSNGSESIALVGVSGTAISIGHGTSETTVNDNFTVIGTTILADTSFGDGNITNVGDINCDSVSVDNAAVGLDIVFGGNTSLNKITLTDNLADALNITESSNSYIKFTTTNSSELITFGEDVNMGGNILKNAQLQSYKETQVAVAAHTTGTSSATFDLTAGNVFTISVSGGVVDDQVWDNAAEGHSWTLIITKTGGTWTWDETLVWAGGVAGLVDTGISVWTFYHDGTRHYAFGTGQGFAGVGG